MIVNEAIEWFAAADLREYTDKYIAIVGQRVISSGDDQRESVQRGKKNRLIAE